MTSEGLGEMFEGDSADMCARKFPLMLMGGRANGPACADGERGPGVNICPKIGKPFPNGQFQNHKLFPENVT